MLYFPLDNKRAFSHGLQDRLKDSLICVLMLLTDVTRERRNHALIRSSAVCSTEQKKYLGDCFQDYHSTSSWTCSPVTIYLGYRLVRGTLLCEVHVKGTKFISNVCYAWFHLKLNFKRMVSVLSSKPGKFSMITCFSQMFLNHACNRFTDWN